MGDSPFSITPPEGFFRDGDEPHINQVLAAWAIAKASEACLVFIGTGKGSGKTWFFERAGEYLKVKGEQSHKCTRGFYDNGVYRCVTCGKSMNERRQP